MKSRNFKFLLLIITILVCISNTGIVAAQAEDRVAIFLVDHQENPIPDVTVNLILNRFNTIDGQGAAIEAIPSGSCITNENGRCEIIISADAPKDQSGFLKGALDLGEYGRRSVIWPGGLLEVPLKLNEARKLENDREAGPFDYDQPSDVEFIQPQPPVYLVGIGIAIVLLVLSFYLYRRSKAQR